MSKKITFYDIPGTSKSKSWSINMWKARYALNFKGVPYQTTWKEYPDVEPHFKEIGMAHTSLKPDGRNHYTCPAIVDPTQGDKPVLVSDSLKIAEYLDEHYPEHPFFPYGTKGLQLMYMDFVTQKMLAPIMPLLLFYTQKQLNPPSAAYFRETREKAYGKKMEELCPEGEVSKAALKQSQEGFDEISSYLERGTGGLFVLGDQIVYADLFFAGILKWIKIVAEDGVWSKVKEWNNGKWAKFLAAVDEKYDRVL